MDIQSIHKALAEGPHNIQQAAESVVQAKQALDLAKREVERSKANVIVSKGDSAKNTTILNALVVMDEAVGLAEATVIEKNAAYMMAVARHERAKDEFDSAKKNANLMEAEMRSFASGRSPSGQ